MKKFEILEHKADLRIKAFGKDKPELFINILKGMAGVQKKNLEEKEEIRRPIKIKSMDLTALLVDFLNEVLYLSQVNKEVYFDAVFSKFTNEEINGELISQKIETFGEDIKAATHHNLDIHQSKDGTWEAAVLFDI